MKACSSLRRGQILDSGFEILEVKELAELEALGIWARHKSGAEVFHVLNDDTENLFSFNFATTPEDSTGAAHILEHSVLCGSENYPLKDAFLVLAQGSLQTFLNAWTFPDKTLYPASSVNESDYFNLFGVYGDAVFRPLLSEWTFMQEGHRLEYEEDAKEKKSRLNITGVVYNEMKGAYSSLDAYAGLWSYRAVLPNTPYDFESGGDPDHIPDLSLEQLRDFHKSRYSPANCRVFLAGNISTEKQLDFLNKRFFSALPSGSAAPAVSAAEPWSSPRDFTVPCPAGSETKSTVMLSWLCGKASGPFESLSLAALTETLLGHDGSPLTRALIDSGLGEDLSPVSGLESELRETVFCVGLRGVGKKDAEKKERKVEELILNELKRLSEEGIPKEEIEAALLGMEFSHKEIRRSGGPFSLVWLRRSMRSWLHGGKPWDSLLFSPLFDELKKKLKEDERFFENLIRRHLLDNPHRAFITIKPETDFLEKKETARARALAEKEAALSETEKREIHLKSESLVKFQESGDSPEALATIPHLSRADLSPKIETIPRELRDAGGLPVLSHELYTNGISYADLAFPVDLLGEEDYPWLPFFSRTVVSLGLPGMDYGEVSSLMARTAGGFYAILHTGSPAPGSDAAAVFPSGGVFDTRGRDWLIYRLKALDEKTGASLDLARRLISEADFSDLKRLRDLASEMKNDMDSGLAPSGHSFAEGRAGRNFSRPRFVEDVWGGLEQLYFVHRMVKLDTAEISRKLVSIRDRLLQGGLLVNLAGNAAALKTAHAETEKCFSSFGGPRPRKAAAVFNSAAHEVANENKRAEVFASPSLQIGFAAMSIPAADFGSGEQAAEIALSHQLSTGALWEQIRMKGGAYGAFAHPDNLEKVFSFSSYRDPNPLRSLETFPELLKSLAGRPDAFGGEDALEKAVIGCYSKETRPKTAAEKNLGDFLRFLYGIEDSHRSARLTSLLALSREEVSAALGRLASTAETGRQVVIAGKSEAEKAAAALGVEVKELPV